MIYLIEFKGFYLGGYGVVFAETPKEAVKKAVGMVDGLGLDPETIQIRPLRTDEIFFDGNY